jgi:hypothetical protein
MPVRFRWTGLDELKEALRRMPADLTEDGGRIVQTRTLIAADQIRAAYPRSRNPDSRHLADEVRTRIERSRFGATGTVTNTSPHAREFENGTQERHTATGASRGSMPPAHVFVPIMSRQRREMYDDLRALLVQHGLTVRGDA